MTEAGRRPGRADADAEALPHAGLAQFFATALAGLSFCWLPLASVVQIDALRSALSWREILELLGRFQGALVLLAAATALAASVLRWSLRWSSRWADALSWLLVLVLVAGLSAGQFFYNLTLWLKSLVGSHSWVSGPWARWLVVGAVLGFVLLYAARRGPHAVVRALAHPLLPLRLPALALTVVAAVFAWPDPQQTTAAAVAPRGAPNVLLLSLDTLAYFDADPCAQGPGVPLMPNLQALGKRSTCFARAYAVSNSTVPATSTLATGVLPWHHHAYQPAAPLSGAQIALSLPKRFQEAGYRTISVTDTLSAGPYQHGTWRAFDQVELLLGGPTTAIDNLSARFTRSSAAAALWPMVRLLLHPLEAAVSGDQPTFHAHELFDRVLTAWRGSAEDTRPVFAWVHSWTPHSPYLPPAQTRYRLLPGRELDHVRKQLPEPYEFTPDQQPLVDKHRLRYHETLMALDQQIGRLLQFLSQRGQLDDLLLVVTADHGESFARGFLGHGGLRLDEAIVRIPLMVKLPGQGAGRVVSQPVSQLDVTPTMLEVAGLPGGIQPTDGRSLLPLLRGQPLPPQPVFSMAAPTGSRFRPLRGGRFAVIDGPLKYTYDLRTRQATLFDVVADPEEHTDLAIQRAATAQAMDALLRARLAGAEMRREAEFGP